MANPEHVAIFYQGQETWESWRHEQEKNHGRFLPDLSGLDFTGLRRENASFHQVNLTGSSFKNVHLQDPDFENSELHSVNFEGAFLEGANFQMARISRSNFEKTWLLESSFHLAEVRQSSYAGSELSMSKFQSCKINRCNFHRARLEETKFLECQLTHSIGLQTATGSRPCYVDSLTLKSSPALPIPFLQLAGLSDLDIEYYKLMQPDLSNEQITDILYRMHDIRATQAIQVNPLFISYSHTDTAFVDKIGDMLTAKGVRYWRDIHNATAGRLEKQVDRAMRLNPTVLIVLSEASTNSDWVEHEVESARALEKTTGRDCLCPITLDDSWKDCDWDMRIMRQLKKYNILDFSEWQDEQVLERQFSKLLRGLDVFYK